MNSIVQEASSIAKAVETAWKKAGKPQKFSIRVFEESTKNFFGITTNPAKIALLFETRDVPVSTKASSYVKTTADRSSGRPIESRTTTSRPAPAKQLDRKKTEHKPKEIHQPEHKPREPHPAQKKEIKKTLPTRQAEKPPTTGKPRELWTDEMVATARNWMKDMLVKLKKSDVTFTTEVKRYHLKFLFNKPLEADEAKEKSMFRNFAHLIMQTVRNRAKKQFKYHKVVLTSER